MTAADTETVAVAPPATEAPPLEKITRALSNKHYDTGALAALRRLDPNGALAAPALHRLLVHVPEAELRGEKLRGWALVIHCLALAAPEGFGGRTRLGRALLDAGFSDKRFVNLLDASPRELRDRLPRAVRFLMQRGGSVHSRQLAELVLTDPDTPEYDARRQRIANDYYRAEYEAEQAKATD